jgi:hypothetical protein
VLDWPNLLVGAVLGFLLGMIPWAIDRARSRRSRIADVRAAWAPAAKRLELLAWDRTTTAADLYVARVGYPIDHWRKVLGPDDFRLMERMEGAFSTVEFWARKHAESPGDGEVTARLRRAAEEQRDAVVAFANMSRAMQSTQYTEVVDAEARAKLRGEYVRHPFRTFKRERRNRQNRRAAGV